MALDEGVEDGEGKPNEEEEANWAKSVTPEQAPLNARKEEISWKRIGVTPDDAHPGGGGGTKSGRQSHTRMRTPEAGGAGGSGEAGEVLSRRTRRRTQ